MKKLLFAMLLAAFTLPASAQKLMDIYKSGTVRLIPDPEYARDNNWDKVFKTYYDTIYKTPMGNRKSLILQPDGSVVVNHQYRNFYSRFSPLGKFEKEFGVENHKGAQFKNINNIWGIINDNTFFTEPDNMGNMLCFDFNGSYIKTMKLNYMTQQIIPLTKNKFAVVGWAIQKTRFHEFVSIVDYVTNQEKVIWEHYTERYEELEHHKLFNYEYKFKKQGSFSFSTMPYSRETGMSLPPKIASVGNKLVVGIPPTGEIRIYDFEGHLISTDKITWAANYITVKEQKEIQQKAIDKYKNLKTTHFGELGVTPDEYKLAMETIIKEMESDMNKISDPIPIPTFSTIIKDSDGNLLFFEFPKEGNANKFNVWVYENKGKFVCQSSFVCDDYNLEINPNKLVFHKGYLYGLQLLKNTPGVPLRLVRFKVMAK